MDTYDLIDKLKSVWVDNVDKNSGDIRKSGQQLKLCVWTEEGYKEVLGFKYNSSLKIIEVVLDEEGY